MSRPGRLARWLAQTRAAMPLVAVAGVAAYTWWLVQSVPGPDGDDAAVSPPSAPDYVLTKATVERFDPLGRRLSVMEGEVMTHYLEGDQLVVDKLRLSAHQSAGGQQVDALARQGRYRGLDSILELTGDARVTVSGGASPRSQGPATIEGQSLRVHTGTRLVTSSQPVRLTTPQGTIRGSSLSHDGVQGLTSLGGRVSGRLTTARPGAAKP